MSLVRYFDLREYTLALDRKLSYQTFIANYAAIMMQKVYADPVHAPPPSIRPMLIGRRYASLRGCAFSGS
jgi:hypothetical protein